MNKQIYNTILKAWSLRNMYIDQISTNAYRLVNSYGDGFPELTIDVYNKNILVQYFKPYEKRVKEQIYRAIRKLLSPENVTEKIRLKGKDVETYHVSGTKIPDNFIVRENGIKFSISLHEGGSTGLFLDQRDNRNKVKQFAQDKEILNCFCYTSSFSIYAIFGGAKKTTNIDLSRKALEWSKNNFLLNQIDVSAHEFIADDVWDWNKRCAKKGRKFDIVIIDPPSFSTSKKKIFSVEKDFPQLIAQGLQLLQDNGLLVFSTNIARMNYHKFFQLLSKAQEFTSKTYKILSVSSQGLDFPTGGVHFIEPYLKFVVLAC